MVLRSASVAASLLLYVFLRTSVAAAPKNQEFRPATADELALKHTAIAPGAHAVILHWAEYQNDGDSFSSEYFRIKILTDAGKKYADIEIPYVKGFSTVADIKARTIRPDGKIVEFRDKVYDKPIIKTRRIRFHAKTFTLPEVTAGSIIEYRYAYRWDTSKLFGTRWILQQELPVLKATLALKPYSSGEFKTYYIHSGLPAGKLPEKKRDTFELELENLPPFVEESFAPPADQLKPRVEFFYAIRAELDPEKFWKKEAKEWSDIIERFIGKKGALTKEATALVAGARTDEEKLRKLYERVQRVRNLSYEEEKTEQEQKKEKLRENKRAEDVLRNEYGHRVELIRLFIGLARAAGFEAHAVRLGSRDTMLLQKNLPDGRQLSGEIALVVLDGKELFLDPGTPHTPFGLLSWENSSTAGLKIVEKDASEWVHIPFYPATDSVTRRTAKVQLEDDVLRGTARIEWNGQDALTRRIRFVTKDEESKKKELEDEVKTLLPEGAAVKLMNVSGLSGREEPLIAEVEFDAPGFASAVGSRTLLPLQLFSGRSRNPFSEETRKHPLFFEYAYRVEDEVELTLPEGTMVETLPKAAKLDMKALQYESGWTSTPTSVTSKRSLQLNALFFSVENYKLIRSFFSQSLQNDQETVVLKRKL